MGWRYEVQMFFHETGEWATGHHSNSLIRAGWVIYCMRRAQPFRKFRLVVNR